MKLAERMSRIGIESAFEVLQRARALEAQGKKIVHLEIGQPDFPTPKHVKEAGKKAIDEGWTGYGPTPGFPDLRDAIAEYISRTRGITGITGSNVMVVPGGKPIMFFTMMAVLEPGDEVIYPNPGFPIYESMINYLGATAVPMPLVESRGFSFDLDTFRQKLSPRTKMVVLNSPANPTGGMMPREDLEQVADMLRDRDVLVLSDEIYSRICYGVEPVSITQFDGMLDKTIILDGFSKTYSMTGWRLGYGVMPLWLADAVDKLMVNSNSCTASFTQRAGLAALTGPQDDVDRMVAEFRRRRDAIVEGLRAIPGIQCVRPKGAFYVLPNIFGTGYSARTLADRLLDEAGVACLAGTAFGEFGEGHLRFSYANSLENIEEALRRIRGLLAR
jgi:aspartate/methionine/tyrosine aminotransferase